MHAERTNVVYEFGPFRLEAREHRLVREGHSVRITGKALPYQSDKKAGDEVVENTQESRSENQLRFSRSSRSKTTR